MFQILVHTGIHFMYYRTHQFLAKRGKINLVIFGDKDWTRRNGIRAAVTECLSVANIAKRDGLTYIALMKRNSFGSSSTDASHAIAH